MASALQGAEEYALHDTSDPSQLERSSFTNHEPEDQDEQVHLASLAEKKRLWWRNAVINSFFIASWYVLLAIHSLGQAFSSLSSAYVSDMQVYLRYCPVGLQ
jgi:hypothetical protein